MSRAAAGKIVLIFMSIWLASAVAFSNGSFAPELPIISKAKSQAEYPLLKQMQDLTLDLQLLEVTLKNRRDSATEEKIQTAMRSIESTGSSIAERFKSMRQEQLNEIYALLLVARRYGEILGVNQSEWDDLLELLRSGQLTAGSITVHGKSGTLNLFSLSPLYLGKQWVWRISPPTLDKKSYWVQARYRSKLAGIHRGKAIGQEAVDRGIALIDELGIPLEGQARSYFSQSYLKLYEAFQTQRYAILQRVMLARRTLSELDRSNTAMGTSEEFANLYNQLLESLFSYGVDFSLSGNQRDFTFKGFLFSESPEQAQSFLKRLKFSPSATGYNSPTS